MTLKVYQRFVGIGIFLLMLSPFVFSHAGYLSRPLLRLSLVTLPILITSVVLLFGKPLRVISFSEKVLLGLLALNLVWEFASCFWALSYSTGIREAGGSLLLLLLSIAFLALRRTVDVAFFKVCLIRSIGVVLLLVFAHTLYDVWILKTVTLAHYDAGITRSTLYALKSCFIHKNSVSAFVLLSLVIVYASSTSMKRSELPIRYFILLLATVMLLFFQSRAAQLALLIFTCSAVLLDILQSRRTSFRKLIGPIALFFVLTLIIAGTGRLRHSSWNSRSSQERMQLWENTIELIKEKPLKGHGVGNWPIVFPKTGLKNFVRIQEKGRNFFLQPHCDYLKVWSETGLIGLLLYLSIPLYLLYLCIKRRGEKDAIYFFALSTFYIVSLVTGRKGELHLCVLLAALMADGFATLSTSRNEGKTISKALMYLLLALAIPLGIYSAYASLLEHRHITNVNELRKIGNQCDRAAFDKNFANNFHPLTSTSRMSAPTKAYYAFNLRKIGFQEDALVLYEEAFLDSPYHLPTKFSAAKLYKQCGQNERARELAEEVLRVNPGFEPAHNLLRSLGE